MGRKLNLSNATKVVVLDDIARFIEENLDKTTVRVVKNKALNPTSVTIRQATQLGTVVMILNVEDVYLEERIGT